MKKISICIAITAISLVAAVAMSSIQELDECFEANVEALARGESSGRCTGPKQMDHWLGRIYCHSENSEDCSDRHGCQS